MKPKFIIFVMAIISLNYTFSQSKEIFIEYDFYFKDMNVENKQIMLRTIGTESLITTKRTIMVKYVTNEIKPYTTYKHVYKNNNTNLLYYSENTPGRGGTVFIQETLDQFNWKLTGKKKIILKYNCQEATTTHRGRDFVAYFTTQVPFKAAPWKFHGLPGVMLLVKTTDDKIKMEAQSLKIQSITKPITNPFADKTAFIKGWDAFKEFYKKRLKRSMDKNMSDLSSMKMSSEDRLGIGFGVDPRIEIIIPEHGLSTKEQREKQGYKK